MESNYYYTEQGFITKTDSFSKIVNDLPKSIETLRKIVQFNMLHAHWISRYGIQMNEERKAKEMNLRFVNKMLHRLKELNGSILTEPPEHRENRLIGTCRDFSVLLCSFLRELKIAARARCGFATYFNTGKYEDHWICEYWNSDISEWIIVDSQLDEFQCEKLSIDFDPCDVPQDKFVSGGQAWLKCRMGEADPDLFGIFELYGIDFVKGNFIRDIAALNKVELLPWDCWAVIEKEAESLDNNDLTFLDSLAEKSLDIDSNFNEIHAIYNNDERIKVPETIGSYGPDGTIERIDIGPYE